MLFKVLNGKKDVEYYVGEDNHFYELKNNGLTKCLYNIEYEVYDLQGNANKFIYSSNGISLDKEWAKKLGYEVELKYIGFQFKIDKQWGDEERRYYLGTHGNILFHNISNQENTQNESIYEKTLSNRVFINNSFTLNGYQYINKNNKKKDELKQKINDLLKEAKEFGMEVEVNFK